MFVHSPGPSPVKSTQKTCKVPVKVQKYKKQKQKSYNKNSTKKTEIWKRSSWTTEVAVYFSSQGEHGASRSVFDM